METSQKRTIFGDKNIPLFPGANVLSNQLPGMPWMWKFSKLFVPGSFRKCALLVVEDNCGSKTSMKSREWTSNLEK